MAATSADPSQPFPPLEDFCRNLSFSFSKSLPSEANRAEGSQWRISYHRQVECIRNQATYTLRALKQMHENIPSVDSTRPFRVGLFIADVLPATGEMMCRVLLDAVLDQTKILTKKDITILGRRSDIIRSSLAERHKSLDILWDWDNQEFLAQFSVVILLSSSMHMPLIEEQLRTQARFPDVPPTVFFSTAPGITRQKLVKLLKTDLVIQPLWHHEPGPEDENAEQHALWSSKQIAPGPFLPDLDALSVLLTKYSKAYGLDDTAATRYVVNLPIYYGEF
ncbi:hypothetical protein, variant [Spizellomyces punctatus DAOM BR117]|uniref:Uncharacterized protein n=1 Tax=Spizellomyces punctatus (strain DAOM BR117) TaxID=645134 RepID=A0A0L0HEZ3_SPIPD|nr:hypothetical protein, variant [Spizellomyces punctatus DAOM BR117]KNC99662.1 hypothetical protein, variant [Spizellomyces punctatus DAOM BR117]|eukprot:XP_016607702.1 hypothetical protein, variant [Spizellomyces punctatus DAOM BR117]